jgi:hypothetical protein
MINSVIDSINKIISSSYGDVEPDIDVQDLNVHPHASV